MATQSNLVSQINDFLIAQLNATGTGRFSQTVFMIGSMQINKSFKCVLLSAKIKPLREECDAELLRLGVGPVPVPDDMRCPITLQEMIDPCTGSDGFNYERHAIVRHITLRGSSPFTRQPMSLTDLFPNRGLRAVIDNHRSAMLHAARTAYAAGRVGAFGHAPA